MHIKFIELQDSEYLYLVECKTVNSLSSIPLSNILEILTITQ